MLGNAKSESLPERRGVSLVVRDHQLTANGYSRSAGTIGKKSEVTNAHERFWQHMQEEATQKLAGREPHLTLLATPRVVLLS